MGPADKEKMAFGILWGPFQFKWMAFGLHGVATSFQCLMDRLLAAHQEDTAAYIDDIIIFSKDQETHCGHLQKILEELWQAKLTVNLWKCTLGKRETQYLGLMVGQDRIRPMADKVAVIK